MATIALIEQHIIFISADRSVDVAAIQANSLIQALATNSQGNDLIVNIREFSHWDGSVWVNNNFYEITCFCSVTFQATIQANIPNLQAAFPQYTIVTWGYPVTFGN